MMIKLGESISGKKEPLETGDSSSSFSKKHIFMPRFLSSRIYSLGYALLLGLTAGIILNFMPCVFPLLGIKLSGIIRQSQERKYRVKNAIFYSAGILFSFFILASLVSFAGYRWGTLFQQSSFIIVIIFIIFAFALSFFGLFKINIPKIAGKASAVSFNNQSFDSFFKGCFVALLSTPCSGPLLGSVLAWTLTQTHPIIFAVFIAIGMGLSLPYILISLFPGILFFIPKPGPWMTTVERVLGFLLLGSALFFISSLNEQLYIPVLSMLLISSIGLWQYGQWGNISRSKTPRMLSAGLLIFIVLTSLYWTSTITPLRKQKISSEYSFSSLLLNQKEHKTSIVIFTADWCTNCKFVESSVLKSAEIEKLFRQNNISVMIADITEKGSEGEQLLNQLGSASIPFLAIFPSGKNFYHPVCLRDIYSRNEIRKAIETSKENQLLAQ
jgi:thiol:disulfide interchange protein DsbD